MVSSQTTKTFAEIRSALDPCCSYIIVEGDVDGVSEEEIRQAFRQLPVKTDDIRDARMYRESRTGRRLLVARLARGDGARIKEALLSQGIAPGLAVFYYGSSPEGKGHAIERL